MSDCDGENMEDQIENLEEARKIIKSLRERYRAQSHQLLAWRRRVKAQEELVARLNKERAEQLKTLSAELILFESRLCRKQKDISVLLTQRENVILCQQRAIQLLQQRLLDAGLDTSNLDLQQFDSPTGETNLDSLNDSDSAVIMEDNIGNDQDVMSVLPRFRPGIDGVTVVRSVSDAVEPGNKYLSLRRSNGFLRRPEILETVYSVEEDGEDVTPQTTTAGIKTDLPCENGTSSEEPIQHYRGSWGKSGRLQGLYGSFERLNETPHRQRHSEEPQQNQVTTYNRVMSNHRSVTKPKDVKYKRINKAKSKSLEELRGRLRNWVDKGNKLALSLDQSYA
ncbi:uncharacterized protein LOC110831223 isoform X3 [Zootermopsis nevadensis]|uniref:uncharacterized protein LOC110831223 isoform X3 n=1 Tax=Zootermopsis nevadensis TaxID=136037 RepID=UPI000B8E213D|nr:uncharacterized protein LOC110831223 isoform X3 [Zootermopsis nevadensis]